MEKAAEAVRAAIMNGIDLIREGAGVDVTAVTFITQICATIVLFLFVRFFMWDKVTNILSKRQELVLESLNQKEEAEKRLEALNEESEHVLDDAKKEATAIKKEAITEAQTQKEAIMQKAKSDSDALILDTQAKLAAERDAAQDEIKQEIIDVAYLLAERIVEANIDKAKNEELVQQFFEEQKNGKRS